MRFLLRALGAASTVTILGTALATALIAAPAQASRSTAGAGHSGASSSAAATPNLDAPKTSTGVITGVVDGIGGRPLTGACVVASGQGGSVLAVTHSDGRYVLGGLAAGAYTLHYSACAAGGDYLDQWSGGASLPVSAATVTLARGQARDLAPVTLRTTPSAAGVAVPRSLARLIGGTGTSAGIPALLPAFLAATASGSAGGTGRGAIAGTVTGHGKPLEGVCVEAYGPGFGRARTSSAGRYLITKLRPGRYVVYFVPSFYCGRNRGNWLPQIYKGINGPQYRGKPTRVPVTAGQTTAGIDAALELGGEISGTVRSESGKILPRVCVIAQGHSHRSFFGYGTTSGKNGRYVFHSIFPGKYQVVFLPQFCGSHGNYIAQWWRDSQTQKHAATIVITAGQVVRHVDAALHPGAIIRGVVRAGSAHGAPVGGICVFAQPKQFSFPYTYSSTKTAKDGSYRLTGLTTGKYRVYYYRGCGNNGNFLGSERTVSVVAGHTYLGIDEFLRPGAIISGTVTDGSGTPIRGICVTAEGRGYGSATTKPNGTYSIIALSTGSYTLSFSGGCGNQGSYAPQYYRGQSNQASASRVGATAGHTTAGVNATMQPGGTITGTVTDASGKRLNNICVQVENEAVEQYGYPFIFTSTRHGVFTVRNLIPGVYAVSFGCFFFGSQHLAAQWFMGQASPGTADFVSAPAGAVASGISAVLRPGGFISGVLRNSAGKRLGGMCVQAIPHGSPISGLNNFPYYRVAEAFTNSQGKYRIGPLAAASYDVQFNCYQNRYGSQWYRGTPQRASATAVPVANGSTASGIDGTLSAGGSISGVVTNGANQPQPNICVQAADTADNSFGYGFTNKHGFYSMRSLSTGTYQVTFQDCGGGGHHVTLGNASIPRGVKVVAPHPATANVTLFPAGSISGTVRGGPGGTLQADVCVVADPISASANYQVGQTDDHGNYRLDGLAPGRYQIYFGDPFCAFTGSGYAPQWFKDQQSQGTANVVPVASGHDTAGIDATLGADGAISGTVTSHGHMPVSGECVTAMPVAPVPDPLLDTVMDPVIGVTAPDGTYSLVGLLPGRYTVKFSVGCGDSGFPTQWWQDARSAGDATVITVSANQTVSRIDAHLHQHGHGG